MHPDSITSGNSNPDQYEQRVKMPEVAVVMPVHNRASTVMRAIDSVLAQDFGDFELLAVDDGSTDGSADIIGSLLDPRVRLIRMETNSGASAARNRGIREASASIICFLDSDDAYLPHKLSTVAQRFRDEPDLGVLVDSFRTAYPTGKRRRDKHRPNPVLTSTDDFLDALFERRLRKATPAISARRDVALATGLFDEALKRREDFDFLVRAAGVARCASTDKQLWLKTWSAGSLSASLETFVPATIRLVSNHPRYLAKRRYRRALAGDLSRHALRLVRQGRFRLLGRDARDLSRSFGTATLIGLAALSLFPVSRK